MKKHKWQLALAGAAVGLVNGFMGGGGGVFAVIALAACGLAQKNAHATAILVILPITVASAVIYVLQGSVDWQNTLFAAMGVVFGGIVGAILLKKIKDDRLRPLFGAILLLAGVRMLF